jgi:MFS family permease
MRTLSRRSALALDALNFMMADVRDGIGPYLAVFLKGAEHWQPGAIGAAMALNNIATALALIPAGLFIDATRWKRAAYAGAGLAIAFGALLIALWPVSWVVFTAEAVLGAAAAILPPALAGITLGLAGPEGLPGRVARNEAFNHAGNLTGALFIGVLASLWGLRALFVAACAFAVASAVIAAMIPAREIDHSIARGSRAADAAPIALGALLRDRNLAFFLLSVLLFHFGNAAMLPLAGQVLAASHPGSDAAAMSACIFVAQAVMVATAFLCGRAMAAGYGVRTIFLAGLLVLPVRGVLFALFSSPLAVILIQTLDGIGAGVFGVLGVVIAARLARGTGRVNLAQSLVALATGLGGSASNLLGGLIVQRFGYGTGFLALSAAALAAALLFATAVDLSEHALSLTARRLPFASSLREAPD